jgi:UDP-glucose 4-epimerase
MTDPAEYYNNNIVKTIRMLDFLKDLEKKPAIMFSSSASVYGEPEILPIAENSKIQPISPYGSTKAMSEFLLRDYGNAYGFDTVCFRYFNAAGAEPFNYDLGQEPNATHIVARVLEASINQKPFTLYGRDYPTKDGTCIRDYVHVWDIAQAHVAASRYLGREDLFDRTVCNLVLNLGTNKGISNQEIIDYVKKHQGLDSVKYEPRRWGDPAELIADATVAKDLLGWRPMFSDIETIIDSAYKWYTR